MKLNVYLLKSAMLQIATQLLLSQTVY